jgi:hypothetical protein
MAAGISIGSSPIKAAAVYSEGTRFYWRQYYFATEFGTFAGLFDDIG